MVRCFIGIFIPQKLREKIEKIQNGLKNLPMMYKLVEPVNLHISLSFLGEVEETKLEEVKKKLDSICKQFNRFIVTINGLKIIPSRSYIRVLALGVFDEKQNLEKIGSMIKEKIGGDVKPPHLTLARVKAVHDKQKVLEELEKFENVKIGVFSVSEVELIKSELAKTGPTYSTLYKSELAE